MILREFDDYTNDPDVEVRYMKPEDLCCKNKSVMHDSDDEEDHCCHDDKHCEDHDDDDDYRFDRSSRDLRYRNIRVSYGSYEYQYFIGQDLIPHS